MTIPVTSPLLPPLEEFLPYLEQIWTSRILSNGGEMHRASSAHCASTWACRIWHC